MFQSVELGDGNTAHLRPGAVLEGVVVQKLAAKQKRDCQHAPDLTLRNRVGRVVLLEGVDALRKVVHAKENGALGETRRREDLRNELAEGGRDGGARQRHDDTGGHLGNELGHVVNLVVEDSADASGHDGGIERGSDEDREMTFVGKEVARGTWMGDTKQRWAGPQCADGDVQGRGIETVREGWKRR